ncbi:FAD-binding domain [Pelagibacterium lentulum]|uniref:Oxidoreductase n=1 Tax=Pelagibacterium lentulum TaxID=2029865 RepID=A0A916RHG8_9HYPH|nr:FAD-binding domain [Pelagibacterium lentulum]GGA54473.1 oxidoreductase [Pelagibacterium lentulum]
MKIAISGCGVAGPTLAYWLKHYGFQPVLIERAPAARQGGYIIDFWGPGFDVAARMGLIPALERDGYHFKRLRTVTSSGRTTTSVPLEKFEAMTGGRYLSIARSDLSRTILAVCEGVETRFSTSIATVSEDDSGLELTFESGQSERFDLLIGADGLHSNVRNKVFGNSGAFKRPMGLRIAALTLRGYRPRDEGHYVMYTRPNRQIARATLRGDRSLFLFVFNEELVDDATAEPEDMVRAIFADAGWEAKAILDRLGEAEDFYSDSICQIRMDRWSRGRVALLGDAAACISLLGGEGAGLSMTEAYVLAGELARAEGDYESAFAAYEARLRPLLEAKQDNALRFRNFFAPPNWPVLFARDALNLLIAVPWLGRKIVARSFTSDFDLPDYTSHRIMAESES